MTILKSFYGHNYYVAAVVMLNKEKRVEGKKSYRYVLIPNKKKQKSPQNTFLMAPFIFSNF